MGALDTRTCPSCAQRVEAAAATCPQCGHRLDVADEQAEGGLPLGGDPTPSAERHPVAAMPTPSAAQDAFGRGPVIAALVGVLVIALLVLALVVTR